MIKDRITKQEPTCEISSCDPNRDETAPGARETAVGPAWPRDKGGGHARRRVNALMSLSAWALIRSNEATNIGCVGGNSLMSKSSKSS